MKKTLFTFIFLITLFLTGCSKLHEPEKYKLNRVPLKKLPEYEIECVKSGDYELWSPIQEIKDKSRGTIMDYIMVEDKIYLLISYDNYYKNYYCQTALYEWTLGDDNFTQLAYDLYDEGVYAWYMRYEDNLVWNEVTEANQWYECTIRDNKIVKKPIDESEVYQPYEQSYESMQGIPKEYMDQNMILFENSEDYIVWEQLAYPFYVNEHEYIYVLDKKTNTISSFCLDDYGFVQTPVAYCNGKVVFLTMNDIKSYTCENDFYSNIYLLDTATMNCEKITENFNSEDKFGAIVFGAPKINDKYVYFYSAINSYLHYEYLDFYYVEIE